MFYIYIFSSGVWKLGKHAEGEWKIEMERISLVQFQCPICNVYLWSIKSRLKHEIVKHSKQLESIRSPVDSISTTKNTACSKKIFLFNYLGLVQGKEFVAINQLAKRVNLLKTFKVSGPDIIDSFRCDICM